MNPIDSLRILGPYCLIEPLNPETRSKAGLYLTAPWKFWCIGKMVKLGEKPFFVLEYIKTKFNQETKRNEQVEVHEVYTRPDVVSGDIILFEKASLIYPLEITTRFYLVHYRDIALKIDSIDSIHSR